MNNKMFCEGNELMILNESGKLYVERDEYVIDISISRDDIGLYISCLLPKEEVRKVVTNNKGKIDLNNPIHQIGRREGIIIVFGSNMPENYIWVQTYDTTYTFTLSEVEYKVLMTYLQFYSEMKTTNEEFQYLLDNTLDFSFIEQE